MTGYAAVSYTHLAVLRAELSYPVSLGDDARGNITRLDNAIDNFTDRIAAVSYTHLDVYKRQPLYLSGGNSRHL